MSQRDAGELDRDARRRRLTAPGHHDARSRAPVTISSSRDRLEPSEAGYNPRAKAIVQMQQTVGNRAVQRVVGLVSGAPHGANTSGAHIQRDWWDELWQGHGGDRLQLPAQKGVGKAFGPYLPANSPSVPATPPSAPEPTEPGPKAEQGHPRKGETEGQEEGEKPDEKPEEPEVEPLPRVLPGKEPEPWDPFDPELWD